MERNKSSDDVKLEICLTTETIDKCIYINPYFKFYETEPDDKYSLENPKFICLKLDKPDEELENSNGEWSMTYV